MKRRVVILSVLAVVLLTGLYIYPERPLYRSRVTVVEASLNGEPVAAEAFSEKVPVLSFNLFD